MKRQSQDKSKKIHVVFVVTNDMVTDRRMDRICNSLYKHGFSITLFGIRSEDNRNGLKRKYHTHPCRLWSQKGPLFYLEFNVRMLIKLLFTPFDAACAVDTDTLLAVRVATWMKRKKMIFDAHESFIETPELYKRHWVKSIWKVIDFLFARRLSATYTINEMMADRLSKYYGIPFEVILNVPELDDKPKLETTPSKSIDPYILLYQGVINQGRWVEEYIRALAYLPFCHLWLVGVGDLFDSLKKYSEQQPYASRIHWFGRVEPPQLKDITSKAFIGLNVLSENSQSYHYSLANKFFDYMHSGIPSVNSPFPNYRRIIETYQCAVYLDVITIPCFVDCIQRMIDSPEIYTGLKMHTIQASRDFSWQHEESKLINLYDRVLGHSNTLI
ncbi:MAG TPA: hypothetical protein PKC30_10505 [Saprospiraceae bacterium]|mgnify:CR=1 FL=1|nr:hypothetical protein [Saprospiraceae bacterium]